MGVIRLRKNNKKLKIMLAFCLVGFLTIFSIALATTDDFRESFGLVCLVAGLDLINPIPTLDWIYFVFPVAVLIYYITPPSITREKAVLIAYILSHVAGAILILIGIALLGEEGRKSAGRYLRYMFTSPLFIAVMILSIVLIIGILYFDFKLKRKKSNIGGRS